MAQPNSPSTIASPLSQAVGEVLLITAMMFIVASGLPPDVNEAHYLSKARHYWNPDWCSQDAFLTSSDAHLPFYWTFGWITQWTSLSAAAWIGRMAAWLALATAWQRLSWALVPVRNLSLLTAAIWIALVDRGHMSGEWILGGVEAKVFAYPLVLLGLTDLVKGRWRTAWIWFGAASAFHVLVGGWAVVTALFSWCLQHRDSRPDFASLVPALLVGGALSFAGLLPAVQLSTNVPAEIRDEACRIYVYQRLSHHLLLRAFEPTFIARHLTLMIAFVAVGWRLRHQTDFRPLWGFVLGAIGLVAIGGALDACAGTSDLGARLLRYYWFRPSDVYVPLGLSLAAVIWLQRLKSTCPRLASWLLIGSIVLLVASFGDSAWRLRQDPLPAADRQGGIHSAAQWEQWKDVGAWCEANLPANALVLAPPEHQTFRWYAGRSEVVNGKDIPQDAGAIVAWQQRRLDVEQLRLLMENAQHQLAHDRLLTLAAKYNFDFVVLPSPVAMPLNRLIPRYQNLSYIVLQIK